MVRVNIQGCVPACYDGTETPTPVTVVLSDPVNGGPVTRGQISEMVQGYTARSYTRRGVAPARQAVSVVADVGRWGSGRCLTVALCVPLLAARWR